MRSSVDGAYLVLGIGRVRSVDGAYLVLGTGRVRSSVGGAYLVLVLGG